MDNVKVYAQTFVKDDSNVSFNVRVRDWTDPVQYYGVLKLGDADIHANPQKWYDIAMHILSKLQEHQQNQMKEGELID